MKRIALITATLAVAACSEPTAPGRAPTSAASLSRDLLHRAKLAVKTPSSTITQASRAWALTKVGALDPATSNVTWTITATQGAAGTKKLVVTGKVTLKNTGTKLAPIGNVVVTLQHKPLFQWITLSSDVANATAGDAATSAKIVKWTNNSDDSDGVDDDDSEPGDRWNVTTMDENSASGALAFTNGASLAPGATATLFFTASYDNNVLNLPVGRRVRAQIYVTFGNAGLGLTTAPNLDIDGNGAIGADEARVRTVSARLGQKVVPAATVASTAVTLSDAVADLATTGTVSYTNPVFTLGATTGTVTAHVAGGASGGTISNCAHLTGTGTNLQACNTQVVSAESATSGAWKNGDVISYSQQSWGDPAHAAGQLLASSFNVVYPGGELEVGVAGAAGFSMVFGGASAAQAYLPASGSTGPLTRDLDDPTLSPSGEFGGDVLALRFSIDFSDAGVTRGSSGVAFGDLTLCNFSALPLLNNLTVRQYLGVVSTLLGAGSSIYGIGPLDALTSDLAGSFDAGIVSAFAREHLVIGHCPNAPPASGAWKNGDVITYSQEEWGDPTSAAGATLSARFGAVYANNFGVFEVGEAGTAGFSMQFFSPSAVSGYLPDSGPLGALAGDYLNPTLTTGGAFGGNVTALALNVQFGDAGFTLGTTGARFGDLTLVGLASQPLLNGYSVRALLGVMNTALGGGGSPYSFTDLYLLLESVNHSFDGGVVSAFAQDHLVATAAPPPFVWKNGDVISYSQPSWGTSVYPAGALLSAHFNTVFAPNFGVMEIGIPGTAGFSIQFTTTSALFAYLPQGGAVAALNADLLDPITSSSGVFGGAVASLILNVMMSDAGFLVGTSGARFGDLTMCGYAQPGLNGHSVRSFLATAQTAIGGGSTPYSLADLYDISELLDGSFEGGAVALYARNHLTLGACP